MSDLKTVPTWGYKSGEDARIFDLKPGEGLPPGWHDTPQPEKASKKSKPEKNEDMKDEDGHGE